MDDNDPLLASPSKNLYLKARDALARVAPHMQSLGGPDAPFPVIVSEIQDLADAAVDSAASEVGSSFSWTTPSGDLTYDDIVIEIDFDNYIEENSLRIPEANVSPWHSSPLARAARAYRRECQLDFSPDAAGIWLLSLAPYSSIGTSEWTSWSGVLNGFAIIYDRDRDGSYESLGHLWVATAWRRRGIASKLTREAIRRFPLRSAEPPLTEGGAAVISSTAPGLLRR